MAQHQNLLFKEGVESRSITHVPASRRAARKHRPGAVVTPRPAGPPRPLSAAACLSRRCAAGWLPRAYRFHHAPRSEGDTDFVLPRSGTARGVNQRPFGLPQGAWPNRLGPVVRPPP
jgi:hypothetical protein